MQYIVSLSIFLSIYLSIYKFIRLSIYTYIVRPSFSFWHESKRRTTEWDHGTHDTSTMRKTSKEIHHQQRGLSTWWRWSIPIIFFVVEIGASDSSFVFLHVRVESVVFVAMLPGTRRIQNRPRITMPSNNNGDDNTDTDDNTNANDFPATMVWDPS